MAKTELTLRVPYNADDFTKDEEILASQKMGSALRMQLVTHFICLLLLLPEVITLN